MGKIKGYQVPRREALITFEGTDYDGAELTCVLDVSLSTLFAFQRLSNGGQDDGENVFRKFGDEILISWNLQDSDGNPVPATADGFCSQPPAFASAVLSHWKDAVTGLTTPLEEPSRGGDT